MLEHNFFAVDAPKVSVVIPTYRVKYLDAALQSVLAQDFQDYEVIICDDCPNDDVYDFIVHFLKQRDIPPLIYSKNDKRLYGGGTLSRCISLARGTYIKPVFDDDILLPGCLSMLVDVMDRHSDIALVTSRRLLIDENGDPLPGTIATIMPFDDDACVHGKDLVSYLSDMPLNFIGEPTCIMFRRQHILTELGRLYHLGDVAIQWVGDLAMSAKLLQAGHLAMLRHPYSCFRVSREQFSQLGRDKPGIGENGHNDFKRMIRELGWRRAENNELVRVKPLNNPSIGFDAVNLHDRIRERIKELAEEGQTTGWGVVEWLEERKPCAARILAVQTMLRANPDVGTLGAVVVLPEGWSVHALNETLDSLNTQHRSVDGVWLLSSEPPDGAIGQGVEVLRHNGNWAESLSARISLGNVPDFLWVLYAGDQLLPHATLTMGEYRLRKPDPLVWYADEAVLAAGAPSNPILKPDFNIDLLRSYPYIGRNLVISTAAIQAAGGLNDRTAELAGIDLVWRLVEQVGPSVVGHVPEVLQLVSLSLADWLPNPRTVTLFSAITQAHFERLGVAAKVKSGPIAGLQYVEYPLIAKPMVSIIIPTRDQLPVLRACVEGLMERTAYPLYELVIVDNGSVEPDAIAYLAGLESIGSERIRILRRPQRFNFAAINNFAVEQAKGDVLLFLNNDVQISPSTPADWLDRLLMHVLRPEVAMAGPRLNLPAGGVEQFGRVLGMDDSVGPAFSNLPADWEGYMYRLIVQQNVSALSGTCLMMRREVFQELGGFDAEAFPVYYADADLCMKATQAGYLLVAEPDTGLTHMGGATRLLTEKFGVAADADEEQTDRLYARWLPKLAYDPNYHPALEKRSPGFTLSRDAARIHTPLPGRPLPVVIAAHSDWHGCGYYRVVHPFQAMAGELRLEGGLKLNDFRFTDVARIEPDVVVLQGAWLNDGILTQIRRYREFTGAKVILEFDDYLPNIPSRSIHRKTFSQGLIKNMRRAIEQADWIVVSTHELAHQYASFHNDIRIAHNGLLPDWWRNLQGRRRTSEKLRVGWAGGSGHTGDLAEIRSVVKDLQEEVEWVFMGMQPADIQCEYHAGVPIDRYPAKLASLNLDLAIVPLEMNQFNRCKSNLRLLELGACGVPIICTDIEPYRSGLPVTLVRNKHQAWEEAIRSHLADPDALAHAGDQLRESVLANWMLEGTFLDQWQHAWIGARTE